MTEAGHAARSQERAKLIDEQRRLREQLAFIQLALRYLDDEPQREAVGRTALRSSQNEILLHLAQIEARLTQSRA